MLPRPLRHGHRHRRRQDAHCRRDRPALAATRPARGGLQACRDRLPARCDAWPYQRGCGVPRRLHDSRRTISEIAPVRYVTAVTPNVAAARERRPVDLDAIFGAYAAVGGLQPQTSPSTELPPLPRQARDAEEPLLIVEGVGGLLCPITDDFWVIHFAKMTGLPLVIVARRGWERSITRC